MVVIIIWFIGFYYSKLGFDFFGTPRTPPLEIREIWSECSSIGLPSRGREMTTEGEPSFPSPNMPSGRVDVWPTLAIPVHLVQGSKAGFILKTVVLPLCSPRHCQAQLEAGNFDIFCGPPSLGILWPPQGESLKKKQVPDLLLMFLAARAAMHGTRKIAIFTKKNCSQTAKTVDEYKILVTNYRF